MAEETTKIQVGEGTQVQVDLSLAAIEGATLATLDWVCVFEGNKGQHTITKGTDSQKGTDYNKIDDNTYELLVDTNNTGKSSNLKAWLIISGIPTFNKNARREVTPPIDTNIEVL